MAKNSLSLLFSLLCVVGYAQELSQEIIFVDIPSKLTTDAPFFVEASATSGLPIDFSSSDPTIASITADGEVTIHQAGVVFIHANQSGDAEYDPAAEVIRELQITKATQTITIIGPEMISLPESPITIEASVDSELTLVFETSDESIATIDQDGVLTALKTGLVSIIVTQEGDETYEPASEEWPILILKGNQVITVEDITPKTVFEEFQIEASSSSGLPLSYSTSNELVAEVSVTGFVKVKSSGPVTISIDQDGDDTYNPAPSVSATFEINKLPQTITFNNPGSVSLAEESVAFVGSSSAGLDLEFEVIESGEGRAIMNDGEMVPLAAGKITIVAKQSGDGRYLEADPVSQVICINPRAPIVIQAVAGAEVKLTSSALTNEWLRDNTVLSFTGKSFNVNESGSYSAAAVVEGCKSELSNATIVVITGLEEEDKSVQLFPNPTDKYINITAELHSQISIIDAVGKVHISEISTNEQSVFDVSSYPAGIYLVIMKGNGQTRHARFFKK